MSRTKRKGRDAYGRLIVGKWHLEVVTAELTEDGEHLKRVNVQGYDHRGSWFCQTLESVTEFEDDMK